MLNSLLVDGEAGNGTVSAAGGGSQDFPAQSNILKKSNITHVKIENTDL